MSLKSYKFSNTFLDFKDAVSEHLTGTISQDQLYNLMDLIETPYSSFRLFLAFDGLSNMLEAYDEALTPPEDWLSERTFTSDIKEICNLLLSKRKEITDDVPNLDKIKNKKIKDSLYGETTDYPLFTSICSRPELTVLSGYSLLLFHILICSILHRSRENGDNDHSSKLKTKALSAVRKLLREKKLTTIKSLPTKPLSLHKYITALQNLPYSTHFEELKFITDYLASGHQIKKEQLDAQKKNSSEADDDNFDVEYELNLSEINVLNSKEEEQYQEHGGSPDELSSGINLAEYILLSGASNYRALQGATNSIAKENQLFSFAWSELSKYEMVTFLKFVNSSSVPRDIEALKVKILLHLMFWAGMDHYRLATLKLRDTANNKHLNSTDSYDIKTKTLRLHSEGPILKKSTGNWQTISRKQHIDLPLPQEVTSMLDQFIPEEGVTPGNTIFRLNPQQIDRSCQKAISKLKGKTKTRLTLHTIQTYMERQLSRANDGDVATAMLTLGKKIYLARSKVHYSSFNEFYLQDIYIRTCNRIKHSTALNSDEPPPLPFEKSSNVGTPLRPQKEAVRNVIENIIKKINEQRDNVFTTDGLFAFHNLYTTYTVLLTAYATGFRAIKTPFIKSHMIDNKTGFAVIADKTTRDNYHSRMVWVPEKCQRQGAYYEQHLESLRLHLKKIPEKKTYKFIVYLDAITPFFFNSKTLTPEEISPKTLGPYLRCHGYFVKMNAQRHFIKSELQENGCPVDAIETFLGHWNLGQEPWSKSSALHPYDYLVTIQKYLPSLLKRLSFQSIEGLGVSE